MLDAALAAAEGLGSRISETSDTLPVYPDPAFWNSPPANAVNVGSDRLPNGFEKP